MKAADSSSESDPLLFQDGLVVWKQNRTENPQAVIDALVAQTARQGKTIFDLNQRIAGLTEDNERLCKAGPRLFDDVPF